MTRNVGSAVLFLLNIKTIKRRMNRKRDVDIGSVPRKCVIPVVCVKPGKWYAVKHNCVI